MKNIKIIILLFLIFLNIFINVKYLNKYNKNFYLDNQPLEFYQNDHSKKKRNKKIHRYSSINGKCVKTTKYMGNDILGIPIHGHRTKEHCEANNDKCKKYSKKECLKQDRCGYCTNKKDEGMCLNATPSGPINLEYKMCHPSSGSMNDNKFTMGESNGYILTPLNSNDVLPPILKKPKKPLDYNLQPMV